MGIISVPASPKDDDETMPLFIYRLKKLEESTTKQNDAILAKLDAMSSSYMHRSEIIERDEMIVQKLGDISTDLRGELVSIGRRVKSLEDGHNNERPGIAFSNALVNKWTQVLVAATIGAVIFFIAAHNGKW